MLNEWCIHFEYKDTKAVRVAVVGTPQILGGKWDDQNGRPNGNWDEGHALRMAYQQSAGGWTCVVRTTPVNFFKYSYLVWYRRGDEPRGEGGGDSASASSCSSSSSSPPLPSSLPTEEGGHPDWTLVRHPVIEFRPAVPTVQQHSNIEIYLRDWRDPDGKPQTKMEICFVAEDGRHRIPIFVSDSSQLPSPSVHSQPMGGGACVIGLNTHRSIDSSHAGAPPSTYCPAVSSRPHSVLPPPAPTPPMGPPGHPIASPRLYPPPPHISIPLMTSHSGSTRAPPHVQIPPTERLQSSASGAGSGVSSAVQVLHSATSCDLSSQIANSYTQGTLAPSQYQGNNGEGEGPFEGVASTAALERREKEAENLDELLNAIYDHFPEVYARFFGSPGAAGETENDRETETGSPSAPSPSVPSAGGVGGSAGTGMEAARRGSLSFSSSSGIDGGNEGINNLIEQELNGRGRGVFEEVVRGAEAAASSVEEHKGEAEALSPSSRLAGTDTDVEEVEGAAGEGKERERDEESRPKSQKGSQILLRRGKSGGVLSSDGSCVDSSKALVLQMAKQMDQFLQERNQLRKVPEVLERSIQSLRRHLENSEMRASALLNENLNLRGRIRVFVRIRGLTPLEKERKETCCVTIMPNTSIVCCPSPSPDCAGPSHCHHPGPPEGAKRHFRVDHAFPPTATQTAVYGEVAPLVQTVLDGFNVCIIAYGQTGSGKTYTMDGPPDKSIDAPGVNVLALQDLFRLAEERKQVRRHSFFLSMVEIYNDEVVDLMTDETCEIQQTPGGVFCTAKEHSVSAWCDAHYWLKIGSRTRTTGKTSINHHSSRSHFIFTIRVEIHPETDTQPAGAAAPERERDRRMSMPPPRQGRGRKVHRASSPSGRPRLSGHPPLPAAAPLTAREREKPISVGGKYISNLSAVEEGRERGRTKVRGQTTNFAGEEERAVCLSKFVGKLNLVDLAGSERVSESGAEGNRLEETKHINTSLSTLGNVIQKLLQKANHVPYRDSKLTHLLSDSLKGESKTLMLVQVSPLKKDLRETANSLHFAQRVNKVELGKATKGRDYDQMLLEMKRFKEMSAAQQRQLLDKDDQMRRMKHENLSLRRYVSEVCLGKVNHPNHLTVSSKPASNLKVRSHENQKGVVVGKGIPSACKARGPCASPRTNQREQGERGGGRNVSVSQNANRDVSGPGAPAPSPRRGSPQRERPSGASRVCTQRDPKDISERSRSKEEGQGGTERASSIMLLGELEREGVDTVQSRGGGERVSAPVCVTAGEGDVRIHSNGNGGENKVDEKNDCVPGMAGGVEGEFSDVEGGEDSEEEVEAESDESEGREGEEREEPHSSSEMSRPSHADTPAVLPSEAQTTGAAAASAVSSAAAGGVGTTSRPSSARSLKRQQGGALQSVVQGNFSTATFDRFNPDCTFDLADPSSSSSQGGLGGTGCFGTGGADFVPSLPPVNETASNHPCRLPLSLKLSGEERGPSSSGSADVSRHSSNNASRTLTAVSVKSRSDTPNFGNTPKGGVSRLMSIEQSQHSGDTDGLLPSDAAPSGGSIKGGVSRGVSIDPSQPSVESDTATQQPSKSQPSSLPSTAQPSTAKQGGHLRPKIPRLSLPPQNPPPRAAAGRGQSGRGGGGQQHESSSKPNPLPSPRQAKQPPYHSGIPSASSPRTARRLEEEKEKHANRDGKTHSHRASGLPHRGGGPGPRPLNPPVASAATRLLPSQRTHTQQPQPSSSSRLDGGPAAVTSHSHHAVAPVAPSRRAHLPKAIPPSHPTSHHNVPSQPAHKFRPPSRIHDSSSGEIRNNSHATRSAPSSTNANAPSKLPSSKPDVPDSKRHQSPDLPPNHPRTPSPQRNHPVTQPPAGGPPAHVAQLQLYSPEVPSSSSASASASSPMAESSPPPLRVQRGRDQEGKEGTTAENVKSQATAKRPPPIPMLSQCSPRRERTEAPHESPVSPSLTASPPLPDCISQISKGSSRAGGTSAVAASLSSGRALSPRSPVLPAPKMELRSGAAEGRSKVSLPPATTVYTEARKGKEKEKVREAPPHQSSKILPGSSTKAAGRGKRDKIARCGRNRAANISLHPRRSELNLSPTLARNFVPVRQANHSSNPLAAGRLAEGRGRQNGPGRAGPRQSPPLSSSNAQGRGGKGRHHASLVHLPTSGFRSRQETHEETCGPGFQTERGQRESKRSSRLRRQKSDGALREESADEEEEEHVEEEEEEEDNETADMDPHREEKATGENPAVTAEKEEEEDTTASPKEGTKVPPIKKPSLPKRKAQESLHPHHQEAERPSGISYQPAPFNAIGRLQAPAHSALSPTLAFVAPGHTHFPRTNSATHLRTSDLGHSNEEILTHGSLTRRRPHDVTDTEALATHRRHAPPAGRVGPGSLADLHRSANTNSAAALMMMREGGHPQLSARGPRPFTDLMGESRFMQHSSSSDHGSRRAFLQASQGHAMAPEKGNQKSLHTLYAAPHSFAVPGPYPPPHLVPANPHAPPMGPQAPFITPAVHANLPPHPHGGLPIHPPTHLVQHHPPQGGVPGPHVGMR
uniref:Kinesin motor domain-containing protein n=1 Tax=Chromera velia CCMP2878 TaxID=1169474 RepID=A0A0K6S8C1_9ALVE|eukprot:Cvel_23895.t2-p1 / transcript=Cvel_23895.t2 / gene=Cvel_23895 / organism=Chromera_velia_CCMP2878 / gene_product=hypothetical protein / transcript_product=hypothetical protein / location=Cvel_scaffold2518:6329-16810(-) / protein_length=2535 / sequence_SO=supercontig / SO=protein_coding / is_pseudo=false